MRRTFLAGGVKKTRKDAYSFNVLMATLKAYTRDFGDIISDLEYLHMYPTRFLAHIHRTQLRILKIARRDLCSAIS